MINIKLNNMVVELDVLMPEVHRVNYSRVSKQQFLNELISTATMSKNKRIVIEVL